MGMSTIATSQASQSSSPQCAPSAEKETIITSLIQWATTRSGCFTCHGIHERITRCAACLHWDPCQGKHQNLNKDGDAEFVLQDAWAGSRLGNLPASELRLRLFIQHNTLLKKYIVDEWDHGIYSWFIQATWGDWVQLVLWISACWLCMLACSARWWKNP